MTAFFIKETYVLFYTSFPHVSIAGFKCLATIAVFLAIAAYDTGAGSRAFIRLMSRLQSFANTFLFGTGAKKCCTKDCNCKNAGRKGCNIFFHQVCRLGYKCNTEISFFIALPSSCSYRQNTYENRGGSRYL